ncbi:zinc-binding alcohol dehydrogenase family protein [Streptomyces sp. LP11]|uniref:Zinc-binding alcohol dehydrogenase family protein n=1 Tax=Streptomyces pyxinicus TaxID=2970331 RepID=A0ABT2ATZ7_9ACTN|nr:zinc-binding alcohol dehydrogenase family protein [Streptomyces sp. LP11]MCS0599725.1 zinc-binding alcohol dehydrogenase family protein [Streptomyces sp. LP11]
MTQPTTATEVWVYENGGPEQLTVEERRLPDPGPHDVLVSVDTTALSGWDLRYRKGLGDIVLPGRNPFPLPQRLGREGAGTVLAVGSAVTAFQAGDKVAGVVHPENPTALETYRGLGNLSTGIAIPGHQSPGSYASHLIRDESLWLPLPADADLEQAAVTLWPYGTSHRILRDRLRVQAGDTLLVAGGTGPMGLAMLNLAAVFGLRTIATTRQAARAEGLRAAGADEVVVTTDLTAARAHIRDLTGGRGADHAIDNTGNSDLLRLLIDSLRLGGRLCPASGSMNTPGPMPFAVLDLTMLECDIVGIRGARQEDALRVLDLLAQGRVHSPIAARFPLTKAADAHAYMENDTEHVGRILLKP